MSGPAILKDLLPVVIHLDRFSGFHGQKTGREFQGDGDVNNNVLFSSKMLTSQSGRIRNLAGQARIWNQFDFKMTANCMCISFKCRHGWGMFSGCFKP